MSTAGHAMQRMVVKGALPYYSQWKGKIFREHPETQHEKRYLYFSQSRSTFFGGYDRVHVLR